MGGSESARTRERVKRGESEKTFKHSKRRLK